MENEEKIYSYKKNEVYTVKIEDTGTGGEGIAKIDGYTLFVKDAVRGDVCEVKITKAHPNFAYAKLLRVVEPSEYRVEPPCPVSKRCGGCKVMAADYKEQLRFKENKVKNNIEKIGKVTDFELYPTYGLDIPSIFEHYNKCVNGGNVAESANDPDYARARKAFLVGYDRSVPRLRQASHCIGCRECVSHCPQQIKIPEKLHEIDRYVESLKTQA